MLDQAFDALKSLDWGMDLKALKPIDDAVVKTHGDAAGRKELESRLVAALKSASTRDAKDYVCRKLMIVGTAESVPALAALLTEKDHSHMARYALERIPDATAAQALREGVAKLAGALKIGAIASLGVRGEAASVPTLSALLGDSDAAVARAAAYALGAIRSQEAAAALASAKPAGDDVSAAATDASLACAERLLADGKKSEALAIYKGFAGADRPKHVRLAATRGMLACAGKKE